MESAFVQGELAGLDVDIVAVCMFEDQISAVRSFAEMDRALDGHLSALVEQEQFKGKDDQVLLVHTLGRMKAGRVLLVGLGRRDDFDIPDTRRFAARVMAEAAPRRCRTVAVCLPPVDTSAHERLAQFAVEGAILGGYSFQQYRSEESRTPCLVQSLLIVSEAVEPLALLRGQIVAAAVSRARDLVNEPAERMTPKILADVARSIAKGHDELSCTVMNADECEKAGMKLFLAVGRGSSAEPRFIHLTFRPRGKAKARRSLALVGKGVTFDSGGLSLKPSASMVDMKADMAGAAAVMAVMESLPSLGITTEVHGIIAAAENMVSGASYRLGDVYTGLGGKSVEIHNTDAEGRLTLADALAYAVNFSPDEVVDIATLTGSCVVALGPQIAGLMGNDNSFLERFSGAARRAGEEVWQLPLPRRLKAQLKSEIADLKNVGERWGGALTAGLFLKEFVGKIPWLHLDIAGPAMADKADDHIRQGGTGFGVASLIEYLVSREASF